MEKRILVACEESQAVTKEFRKLGFEAFSCDLLPCSGGHPEWHFGDKAQKSTCLWLKNLPKLNHTNIVEKGEFVEWVDKKTGRLKRQAKWYLDALTQAKTPQERRTLRSKTFPGIAKQIAEQWGQYLTK